MDDIDIFKLIKDFDGEFHLKRDGLLIIKKMIENGYSLVSVHFEKRGHEWITFKGRLLK